MGCQDSPWWESDWPLLIITKKGGRKVTREAAEKEAVFPATSAAVQLHKKWEWEDFLKAECRRQANKAL